MPATLKGAAVAETLPTPKATDAALLRAFRLDGRHEAFAELVRRYQHPAYRIAFARTGNHEQAEEAVQEAFLFLAKAKSERAEAQPEFRLWFFGVVSNVARHAMRSERRAQRRAKQASAQEKVNAMATALRSSQAVGLDDETRGALLDALQDLKQEHRVPLILHFLEGLTQSEVGKLVGLSQSRVARRIGEALDVLRTRMARQGVTLGAAALPGLLQAPDLLLAPPGLQKVLLSRSFLESAATAESIRYAAAGSFSATSKFVLAVACLAVAAAAGWFFWHGRPSPNQATAVVPEAREPQQAAAQAQPEPATVASKRWTFENGKPEDLELLQGTWNWLPRSATHGPCMIAGADQEAAIVKLPVVWPARPMVLRFKVWMPRADDWALSCYYLQNETHIIPHRVWTRYRTESFRGSAELMRMRQIDVFVKDRYIISYLDDRPFCVRQFERPNASQTVTLAIKTWCVTEIALEPLAQDAIPAEARDVPALIESLGAEAHQVDEWGRERGAAPAANKSGKAQP